MGDRVVNFLRLRQAVCGDIPDYVNYRVEYGRNKWDIMDNPIVIRGAFQIGAEGIAFRLLDPQELEAAKAVAAGAAQAEVAALEADRAARRAEWEAEQPQKDLSILEAFETMSSTQEGRAQLGMLLHDGDRLWDACNIPVQ